MKQNCQYCFVLYVNAFSFCHAFKRIFSSGPCSNLYSCIGFKLAALSMNNYCIYSFIDILCVSVWVELNIDWWWCCCFTCNVRTYCFVGSLVIDMHIAGGTTIFVEFVRLIIHFYSVFFAPRCHEPRTTVIFIVHWLICFCTCFWIASPPEKRQKKIERLTIETL